MITSTVLVTGIPASFVIKTPEVETTRVQKLQSRRLVGCMMCHHALTVCKISTMPLGPEVIPARSRRSTSEITVLSEGEWESLTNIEWRSECKLFAVEGKSL
jgi:hypothetical protein